MALIDTIERLQHAPRKKRQMILALWVTIGMAVALGIWVVQLRFQDLKISTTAGSIAPPLKVLWESFKNK